MQNNEEKEINENEVVVEANSEEVAVPAAESVAELTAEVASAPVGAGGSRDFKKNDRRRNERKPSRRPERARQEFDQKILSVRRVTRVVAGGRRFSFSVAVAIGDKKGRVGVGLGKSGDTPLAVEKAVREAKKSMVTIPMKGGSIAHPVEAKYTSARIMIAPAPGKGVAAGSSVRTILELAGIKEVSAKILSRSKNKLNNAKAAIRALMKLKSVKTQKAS